MTITSSTYTVGHAQIDGREYVQEEHTDNMGVVHTAEYLAAVGTDYAAVAAARASQIAQQLAEAEAQALLG